MASDNPFGINIYGPDLRRRSTLGSPLSCVFTPRLNGIGTGQMYLSPRDPKLKYLLADGARVGVTYRGEPLVGGPVMNPEGTVKPDGQVLIQFQGDWRRLRNTAAWVNPTEPLTPTSLTDSGQTVVTGTTQAGTTKGRSGYYRWLANGSREEAIKSIVAQNLSRLQASRSWLPDTFIHPNLGRGGAPGDDRPTVRMSNLEEAIAPMLTAGNLRAEMWQGRDEDHWRFDVFETRTWPLPLTVASGRVGEGKWSRTNPTATSIIIGGPGEEAARIWYAGGTNTALEQRFGDVIEVVKDATNDAPEFPEDLADELEVYAYYLERPEISAADKAALVKLLTTSGSKALAEGAPVAGVSAQLIETPDWHFGGEDGYHLGDRATVQLGNGLEFTERFTECALSFSPDSGLKVTPTLGEKTADPRRLLWRAVANLYSRNQRNISDR